MPPERLGAGLRALVVGAGIAGLLAARELAARGVRVSVADPRGPGGGATSRAAGIVTLQMPPALASWSMEAILEYGGLGVSRRLPGLIVAPRECVEAALEGPSGLGEPLRLLSTREASEAAGLPIRVPPGWAAAYTLDAVVDAGGLVARLVEELSALGVEVEGRSVGNLYRELARGGYDVVVVASGAWVPEVLGVEPAEIAGSAIYNCEASSVALGAAPSAIIYVENNGDAAYAVPEAGGRVIVGDGPNSRLSGPEEASPTPGAVYDVLEVLSLAAPAFQDAYPVTSWAAPCLITGDGLPAVGEWVSGIYLLAGLDGYGLMAAPTLARMLADHIVYGHPLPETLSPHRGTPQWSGGPPPEPFRGCG
jgi:sarcosine oxidase subunit beta